MSEFFGWLFFWVLLGALVIGYGTAFTLRWRSYHLAPFEFRKRPVKVQAVKVLDIDSEDGIFLGARGKKSQETPTWFEEAFNRGDIIVGQKNGDPVLYIKTMESDDFVIRVGMWIIRGVKGEIYGCDPEVFDLTYD